MILQRFWQDHIDFLFISCCPGPLQEVLLLPTPAVPELKVPDAHPVERDEGAGCPEEGPTPGLLQHPQGGAHQLSIATQ